MTTQETAANALLHALRNQRTAALDAVAQLEAQLAVTRAELESVKEKLAEFEKPKEPETPEDRSKSAREKRNG